MRSRPATILRRTKPRSFATDTRLTPAYDDLVPEMLGITNTDMYVSDGGHYDNLGLMALLRARCAEIWCIESSPDPTGTASELTRVLALAKYELDATHALDRDLVPVALLAAIGFSVCC